MCFFKLTNVKICQIIIFVMCSFSITKIKKIKQLCILELNFNTQLFKTWAYLQGSNFSHNFKYQLMIFLN